MHHNYYCPKQQKYTYNVHAIKYVTKRRSTNPKCKLSWIINLYIMSYIQQIVWLCLTPYSISNRISSYKSGDFPWIEQSTPTQKTNTNKLECGGFLQWVLQRFILNICHLTRYGFKMRKNKNRGTCILNILSMCNFQVFNKADCFKYKITNTHA